MLSSLAYFATVLRKDFTDYCNKRLSDMNLSQGQLYFILYIGKHPDCSPKELAEGLHMDMGHTARALVKLEQGGFLSQKQDLKDRRAHVLRLTEAGEAVFHLSHDLFSQWDDETMASFTPEEREQLLSLLQKLIRLEGGVPCVRNHSQPH